jgi:GTP-binding protein
VLPVVALVGRPNVGKSTLFNRLIGRRAALVHDRPGVTRDRHYETAAWLDRDYLLVDTGGLEPEAQERASEGGTAWSIRPGNPIFAAMRAQAEAALAEADVVVLLVDRQAGLTPEDEAVARLVRASGRPVVVAVNKCDEVTHDDDTADFWSLGFEAVVAVSAEHNRGSWELMEAVVARFPPRRPAEPEVAGEIRVAVLGRPNVGKSTLVNRLVGEERHVVHDLAGTTVDAVDSVVEAGGRRFRVVDTAGVRRRARIEDRVEELAVGAAIRTIERCHVVMLVIDGTVGPGEQDARLAGLVEERGRALVVLVNKWDAVKADPERDIGVLEDEFSRRMPHTAHAPVLYIAARTGKGCQKLLTIAAQVYDAFDTRIPTARLNAWLRAAVAAHSPPQLHHHPVRLQYVTQVRVRPPTFTIFVNNPQGVVDPYDRYLKNRLREEFGFLGCPLKIDYRRRRRIGEAAPGEGAAEAEE